MYETQAKIYVIVDHLILYYKQGTKLIDSPQPPDRWHDTKPAQPPAPPPNKLKTDLKWCLET